MKRTDLATISRRENGVLSLAELHSVGVTDSMASRRVASNEWSRPLPQVYFVFPSTPTFDQRVATVAKWAKDRPITFCGESAGFLHGIVREAPLVVEVVVPPDSPLRSTSRCRVRRSGLLFDATGDPPRTSLEQTVLDLVNDAVNERDALHIVICGIQQRMRLTNFTELAKRRKRLRHRRFLQRILEITDDGVESHLELAYLRNVERRHGLPRSMGQKRERIRGRWIRSDRWYDGYGLRAELDGELAHPGRASDSDVMRDNDVLLALDEITLRYRWPQVTNTPCLVAAQVARALRKGGWSGSPTKCSTTCDVERHLARLESPGR